MEVEDDSITKDTGDNLAEKLFSCSLKVLATGANVPKGGEYSRRFALHSLAKKKVQELDARMAALSQSLVALIGVGEPNEDPMADVLDGINLCIRRSDRALKLGERLEAEYRAKESGLQYDEKLSGRKRKRKFDALSKPIKEVIQLVTVPATKLKKVEDPATSLQPKRASEGGGTILYSVKKDNFQWVYRSLLTQKVHELSAYNIAEENKLKFPTAESRSKFIKLVSELPRADCLHTSMACLENYNKTVNELDEAGFLADEFGNPAVSIPNPYQSEIEALSPLYSGYKLDDDPWGYDCAAALHSTLFSISEPRMFKRIDESSNVEIIHTKEQLEKFVNDQLNKGIEMIAIDVESHSQFSFKGYSCLIQLSTVDQDYIIDPSRGLNTPADMGVLNEIFCCPSILKVLHGGHYDVQWLQTDFGIYFVNLFDTFFASKVLEVPGGNSLANLVDYYCDVRTVTKQLLLTVLFARFA